MINEGKGDSYWNGDITLRDIGDEMDIEFVWKPEKTEGNISDRERERRDFICRAYYGGAKKFVEWFNPESEEFSNVPEVALCDEVFIQDDPDYAPDFEKINSLEIGESMILDNGNAIIMRVK